MPAPSPVLESIVQSLNYGDLPEIWRVPEIDRFSQHKTFYDYQRRALENAARALYLYYGKENGWQPIEPQEAGKQRKQDFAELYGNEIAEFSINRYESHADRRNQKHNPVFKILAEYITPRGDTIPYGRLINRMCFWMATGSGKTLVMVKIIEYLHRLKRHRLIPPHNVLVLAPSDYLIGQIRRTIEEFNQSGLHVEFVPLRESGRMRQGRLDDAVTVYYHRSDTISDVQKDALTDYRRYEHDGKWYVLLDEAHKGGKEDSKRQAYYALMAREGFLLNFSATFTDPEDIVTTVKKYNLEEFIKNGHGKNIYLNESEYQAFKSRSEELSVAEKTKIVLKSLMTLAHVSRRVAELRGEIGRDDLYHLPLMLTLVNSVNTDAENASNDLWMFFQILRQIAEGNIDEELFREVKGELLEDWHHAQPLFGAGVGAIVGMDSTSMRDMNVADLREAVFLSRHQGALQFIRHKESNKELAFQLVNADRPFAMFKIGDTSRWRHEFLVGFEETVALKEHSFFENLETSGITILMGSRAFFESWDSKRPNVINFINIGGIDAKKFVVQAVGRGVRIEPVPGNRRRLAYLNPADAGALHRCHDQIGPPETLFLFATNRTAIKAVLEGIAAEKSGAFEKLTGFETSERPKVNGKDMPLLVPEYKKTKHHVATRATFALSDKTLSRIQRWFERTSDSVFVVRDNLAVHQMRRLREMVEQRKHISIRPEKDYIHLPFLQSRLISHLSVDARSTDGLRELDERDIIHFREIRARLESHHLSNLNEKIRQVAMGDVSDDENRQLADKYVKGEITRAEFEALSRGRSEDSFNGLTIRYIAEHYYVPIVTAEAGKADCMKHIVKVESEVKFLNDLERWLEDHNPAWDAWMFSKIDESLDDVYIPYFDHSVNEYRRFLPDFIFWMCKKNQYRIVFVDPKGPAHASVHARIDGYAELFENNGECRVFSTGFALARNVTVKLVLFHPDAASQQAERYAHYWHDGPEAIFA